MDAYLGRKAHRINGLDYTLLVILLFFTVVSIGVFFEYIDDGIHKGDKTFADYIISLLLVALFVWLPLNIILKRKKAKRAKDYAFVFNMNNDSIMTLDEVVQAIATATGKTTPPITLEKELILLLNKKFLTNIKYDIAAKKVILLTEKAPAYNTVQVKCPNCGTVNTIVAGDVYVDGDVIKCQACGMPLKG